MVNNTDRNYQEFMKLLNDINQAIEHHERFRNAYFFAPPQSASLRRSYERKNSFIISIIYKGKHYKYSSDVSCSCRYVYYKGKFTVDNQKKDIRSFKKVKADLENILKDFNESP